VRTGVVLAAGFGSRLASTGDPQRLKPLTAVAGVPLLVRTLRTLRQAGCHRVVVVVGFQGERLEREMTAAWDGDLELLFAHNPRYDLANGVSVLAARSHVPGDFVLTMADHVFGDELATLAAAHEPPAGGATLLVDRKLDTIFDMDDATKVRTDGARIVTIGKQLTQFDAVDTGFFVCTPGLFEALDTVFAAQGDASLSQGIAALAATGRMHALDVGDGFWQDVDTPEMLAHADACLRERGR
jgi:choline kinase